jgi:hypothetical protein
METLTKKIKRHVDGSKMSCRIQNSQMRHLSIQQRVATEKLETFPMFQRSYTVFIPHFPQNFELDLSSDPQYPQYICLTAGLLLT